MSLRTTSFPSASRQFIGTDPRALLPVRSGAFFSISQPSFPAPLFPVAFNERFVKTCSAGYAGFDDQVNNHYFRLFSSAVLMSAVTAGITMSQPQQTGYDSQNAGTAMSEALGQQLGQVTAQLIAKNMNISPSLSQSLGFATIAAFDSGNLPNVATALHQKFPDKPIILAGDNDQHLEAVKGVNPGKVKAQEAARLTGGKVLLPIFAPGEQSGDPKGFTDFNDLVIKSALGREGLDRQVGALVSSFIEQKGQTQRHGRSARI